MSKAKALLQMIRSINCIMMGFAVIVGASLAIRGVFSSQVFSNLFLGFVTAFTLTGASMVINDYYDRNIDAINEPNRPIPKGTISSRQALLYASFLTSVGFVAAFFTNIPSLFISILSWAISATYATIGKQTGLLGNFLVSICVAVPFIYGSFVVGKGFEMAIILLAIMAFLSNTGREVTKGIVDIEGDRSQNIRTIAVAYGGKTAAVVASVFFILAVVLSPLPLLLNLVSQWFLPLVVVTDIGLIASSVLLIRDYSRKNAKKIKNWVLIWFLFGLLAFIAGTFG
jgi:geranylgeranylglycerol-phosphate geranylgeranyltransferase